MGVSAGSDAGGLMFEGGGVRSTGGTCNYTGHLLAGPFISAAFVFTSHILYALGGEKATQSLNCN